MKTAFSRKQDRTARVIFIPIAALVASHVVFTKQFPWQATYQFPLPYFLTVVTVMFSCREVNVRLFLWMDTRLPFNVNPVERIGRQISLNAPATMGAFLVVFPLSQLVYAGRWPAFSTLITGMVVCAVIATIFNGAYIFRYLLRTIDWEKAQKSASVDDESREKSRGYLPPATSLIRVEVSHGQLLLLPEEIAYFYSTGAMVLLVKTDGAKIPTAYQALTQLSEQLTSHYFFPLSRQIVVGLGAIKAVKDDVNRKLVVSLVPSLHQHRATEQVVVSRYRSAEFSKWLQTAVPS
ncbi:LytTR family DNA-binding domain-containing protein [Runella slithyformis]|uniref:LytTr DNA-binding region n=1 Tax=Runella slithyformis (strain ATCC 29530 / DSM 19594 / LMG 11500 / NCIMB 11436 / LSU 4) TaxID=761193 RepID=A0A7U4E6Q8_RUNSL|nr:LytTR family DNA-binding domain-containing protein [Runella slithyformis]AEI49409.1 LytTr DNA-binding region [Runella slithyformis DSM 19594]